MSLISNQSDFRMTMKNVLGKCSSFVLSANGWKDQNMDSSFSRQRKPSMEKTLFDVKAKYRLISRKFSGMKFFHPSLRLTNQKPRMFVFVSLYFRSFVVSVLFARFHIKEPQFLSQLSLIVKPCDRKNKNKQNGYDYRLTRKTWISLIREVG